MVALKDCLSTLSVIATAGRSESARDDAVAAIDHYLDKTSGDASEQLAALGDLRDGLADINIDTGLGAMIWDVIDQRVQTRISRLAHRAAGK